MAFGSGKKPHPAKQTVNVRVFFSNAGGSVEISGFFFSDLFQFVFCESIGKVGSKKPRFLSGVMVIPLISRVIYNPGCPFIIRPFLGGSHNSTYNLSLVGGIPPWKCVNLGFSMIRSIIRRLHWFLWPGTHDGQNILWLKPHAWKNYC